MKAYIHNPRKIKKSKLEALRKDLEELGDLGGIVHDLNTDQLVGGHQRLTAMFGEEGASGFNVKEADIQIVQTYKKPTKTGTVAVGFINWKGEQYSYRQVRYTKKQFQRANIVANLSKGSFDWDKMANNFTEKDLIAWGMDYDHIDDAVDDLVGMREVSAAFETEKAMKTIKQGEAVPPMQDDENAERPPSFKNPETDLVIEHTCPRCGYQWSGKEKGRKKA